MSSFRNEAWIASDIADRRRRLSRRAHSTARRVWRPAAAAMVALAYVLRVRLEWRKTEAFTRKEGSWTLVTLPPPLPSLPQYNRQRAHGRRRRILPNRPYVAPCAPRAAAATVLRHSGRTSSNLNYCCCLQPTNRGLEVFKVFQKLPPG